MATLLGSSTTGGGGDFFAEGDTAGSKWTAVATGTMTTVTIPFTNGSSNFKVGAYTDSSGSPGTLLATSTNTVSGGTSPGTATFSGVSIVSGTPYWLFLLPVGGGNLNLTLAASGGYVGTSQGAGVTTFPTPFGTPGFNNGTSGAIAMLGDGTLGAAATGLIRTFNPIPFM